MSTKRQHNRSVNAVEEPKRTKKSSSNPSPVIAQYFELKANNPGYMLFYQLGDFYELFFDDAIKASEAIGLTLTKRGTYQGKDIPMAGVPLKAANEYLQKAIQAGFRVAVVEQLEDPAEAKKRGSKAVVKRDITRLVTPGTLTEDALLEPGANNYLTSLFQMPNEEGEKNSVFSLASLDISTGEFLVSEVNHEDLSGELMRINPSELIHSDSLRTNQTLNAILAGLNTASTPVPNAYFNSLSGEADLKKALAVTELGGFGAFSRGELAAIGALLKYVEITQIGKQPNILPPTRLAQNKVMVIDAATRASLELVKSTRMQRKGSLLEAIDRTVTSPGARTLAARINAPLNDKEQINKRHDAVQFFLEQTAKRQELREILRGSPDMARSLSRLKLNRAGPRDLGAIRSGLNRAEKILNKLEKLDHDTLPEALQTLKKALLFASSPLRDKLNAALNDELPLQTRDGDFIKSSYNGELAEQRMLRDESRSILANLQAEYRELTNIKGLKIRHNNQFGYFVEVTQTHANTLLTGPLSETFRHRQTLANAVRFNTEELIKIEAKITMAADRALAIEKTLFEDLSEQVETASLNIADIAAHLAKLDVSMGLAELAESENYVRPVIEEDGGFSIEGGRHAVVEQALRKAKSGPFIENDCHLGENTEQNANIWILTGPNMAGKSTYLRQNALMAILAQMGSYVPAKAAHIGLVDRLFSRVGATDDLAQGRSTFMVEMVETAAILNQATKNSLVILDEIGRGTATFDGLSIAWATIEYLHNQTGCRTLFATHYHELTTLPKKLEKIANATIEVKEWKDDIVFLHQIKMGAADRSYGIQVAKLAGMPKPVIARANEVLSRLENQDRTKNTPDALDDLPLFFTSQDAKHVSQPNDSKTQATNVLIEELEKLNPDDLTPKAALELLYKLKSLNNQS